MTSITQQQQRRLQTIYTQWAKRFLFDANTREARLAEMSRRVNRIITTASDLNSDEAKLLIDDLQAELGIAETHAPIARSRRDRQKASTEGRRDQQHQETTLVSPSDTRRIQREMTRLGWTQARLEAFLASASSPIGRRTQIRTLYEANRTFWALKGMPTPKPTTQPTHAIEHTAAS
jgi:hypothetical protein